MKKNLLIAAVVITAVVIANVINPNTEPTPTATITEATSFKHQNAWYWVIQYNSIATRQDIEQYVHRWANPTNTSYFFAYRDTLDLSVFASKNLTFPVFANTIVNGDVKPTYGFYKMSGNDAMHDDALWLLQQSLIQ